ncbi:hypothetical protein [Tissierella sp.]|nr:hypothetical protein [Tissierella sp.]MDR7856327.1 hypothetical protein [Tissierella sp.]
MLCFRCLGDMVQVMIVNRRGREYRALVCTKCGRTYSKDRLFKK